jgi:hypothetical protein
VVVAKIKYRSLSKKKSSVWHRKEASALISVHSPASLIANRPQSKKQNLVESDESERSRGAAVDAFCRVHPLG